MTVSIYILIAVRGLSTVRVNIVSHKSYHASANPIESIKNLNGENHTLRKLFLYPFSVA